MLCHQAVLSSELCALGGAEGRPLCSIAGQGLWLISGYAALLVGLDFLPEEGCRLGPGAEPDC